MKLEGLTFSITKDLVKQNGNMSKKYDKENEITGQY